MSLYDGLGVETAPIPAEVGQTDDSSTVGKQASLSTLPKLTDKRSTKVLLTGMKIGYLWTFTLHCLTKYSLTLFPKRGGLMTSG